ncbi:ankyrin repeat domain-containing protein [Theileria equi strain WA]|uniref:Ankyrin repeat domain-containing protein n=1 Tax=Theileria equi strain WA TaxID=1537102 RepID=L0B2E9_THEEQ|nr:ankyrin repeat domain-containing protein [Theileria equi strain WA]AFZ81299.1 ankyrin repeat domain-containing protein [Theileria equi strain WA]|eukprot:XP_004830965.1 ankyrin repeat domain-containing protein [Theileria equi strain WA]
MSNNNLKNESISIRGKNIERGRGKQKSSASSTNETFDQDKRLGNIFSMNIAHTNMCEKLYWHEKLRNMTDSAKLSPKGSTNKLDSQTLNELNIHALRTIGSKTQIHTDHKNLSNTSGSKDAELTGFLKGTTSEPSTSKSLNSCSESSFDFSLATLKDSISNSESRSFYENIGYDDSISLSSRSQTNRLFNAKAINIAIDPESNMNSIWLMIMRKIEPFLDVYSLLMIRQTCRALYSYKYRLRSHGVLCFRGFVGYDSKTIFSMVMPLLHRVLELPDNAKIRFDFTSCLLIKDISMVHILTTAGNITQQLEFRQYGKNIKELILDFCHNLTDKGLEVMLTTKLPNLQRLSLVCCRNQNITGLPFMRDLSTYNWPNFTKFRCSFSNIWLEPIQVIADFIIRSATAIRTGISTEHALSPGSDLAMLESQEFVNSQRSVSVNSSYDKRNDKLEEFEIYGSWGSKKLLEKLGFSLYTNAFASALKMNSVKLCSKLTKKIQYSFADLANQKNTNRNSCVTLLKDRGSELLVNCPILVKDRKYGNIGVWTLPISLAIEQDSMELFHLLVKRGARVSIWDYLNKSPLYTSCELNLERFVIKMLKFGPTPYPYDKQDYSPISISIRNGNVNLVKLLIKSGIPLNIKCPHIRGYKSPLYIACETRNFEIIKLLLEAGADPNWKYHHRSTPTLIAYQYNSSWLETFLDYGAGSPLGKRWVIADVLSCSISKGDIATISLLVERFPNILNCEHDIWSKPIIQAAKLGKENILQMLIEKGADVNNHDSYGITALHASSEEGHLACMEILISNKADLNKQDNGGRDPLHLACMENREEAVKLLISKGANPNVREKINGETPLMSCIRTRNEDLAILIINESCLLDYNICDNTGRNSLLYSLFFGQYRVSDLLTKKMSESANTNGKPFASGNIAKEKHTALRSDKKLLRRILNFYKPKTNAVK